MPGVLAVLSNRNLVTDTELVRICAGRLRSAQPMQRVLFLRCVNSFNHPPPTSQATSIATKTLPVPPPRLLRPPRGSRGPRAHRLPAGETPSLRRVAMGRDCGNGGLLPERARLPRPSPPHPEQRNPVWRAWAVLCLWKEATVSATASSEPLCLSRQAGYEILVLQTGPQSTL